MAKTWVLVAHEAGARIFLNRGPSKGIELLRSLDHPEGRQKDGDLNADRPGRIFQRSGPLRHATSREEGPHAHLIANFARDLANSLRDARVNNEYERLVLVAPPSFLGLVRAALDSTTHKAVIATIDKNLAHSDEAELVKQLEVVMAV